MTRDELLAVAGQFAVAAAQVHDGQMLSAHVYGSVARDAFGEHTSDLDLLIISERPCSEKAVEALRACHARYDVPLDVVCVTAEQAAANLAPWPVDLVLKPDGQVRRCPEGRMDLLLDRQDAHEAGVQVHGEPDRVPAVPWPLVVEALAWLLPHVASNFKNPVLMLCRVLYALEHQHLCSKPAAGKWALGALPEDLAEAVQAALNQFAAGTRGSADAAVLQRLEGLCRDALLKQQR